MSKLLNKVHSKRSKFLLCPFYSTSPSPVGNHFRSFCFSIMFIYLYEYAHLFILPLS